ncbi:MAG TPA: 2-C-methyl-D-erythritol 4-phosphate cytidylyltransferase [Syntrophomonadaceae bacterium]|nr:2-C-methyl-D-erythritol 4-phosphate cytidylyltransferase [Syntrophomonadaceae bacterium]HNX28101.1 2-C-methyl-D-erythritol 4-phosphate cytidylyltransferase [Syntrophomonadaceae bacterium]HPR93496.1 2-C-methyl-D-erythritol 4-phosphate cytidylyltransferase [Syntrophomonadaceae bacterium]
MDNNLRVVVAAAGIGKRMESKINKQYILLEDKPLLTYCIEVLEKCSLVQKIVIVAHAWETEYCQKEIIEKYGYMKVSRVVAGGAERQDSVFKGLEALGSDTEWVAVTDGARPFITLDLIEALATAAYLYGAAVPGVLTRDTIKTIDLDSFVMQTLNRTNITAVQTPQVFDYARLFDAYKKAFQDNFYGTDDASIYERYAGSVKVIKGDPNNIKITHPEDLIWAQAIINARRKQKK